jgi:predicted PhzF superfamily epimerase YddE/YHI9
MTDLAGSRLEAFVAGHDHGDLRQRLEARNFIDGRRIASAAFALARWWLQQELADERSTLFHRGGEVGRSALFKMRIHRMEDAVMGRCQAMSQHLLGMSGA